MKTRIFIYILLLQISITMMGNNPGDTDRQVIGWESRDGSLWVTTKGGTLRIQPFLNKVLHIQYGNPEALGDTGSFAVLRSPEKVPCKVVETKTALRLENAGFSVQIEKENSLLSFYNGAGKKLLEESPIFKRSINPQPVGCFKLTSSEALYGLGQFRDHELNLRGRQRELVQFNTQAAVPVLLSTNGWGMFWDNPSRTIFTDHVKGMFFASDEGKIIDYYVFIGNNLDSLISAYRELTGKAPMLPYWALGLHQSKNKYGSQNEVVNIVQKMRNEKIPLSSIFIDYYYWGKYGTGSHRFDENLFPDIKGMLNTLHNQYDTKTVITVWPTFKPGTENYEAMKQSGFLLEGAKALDGTIYDAFNPEAARLYWNQVEKGLMGLGIDGWFLDGPEPDQVNPFLSTNTYAGPAAKVRNVYPLVHSTTFYNGLMKIQPNQRPYLLTRCAWAGQQRNATAIWSGDIETDFEELKKQITAGLNFVASGIPYWTTDIGGYFGGDPNDSTYREVYTRWWQYGTFCPIFRTHGKRVPNNPNGNGPNELWTYGDSVREICARFDCLRYRLLPYIYSLTSKVTFQNYTPMRLLAFDFPEDVNVLNLKDEFMYGPSFLVCPVTEKGVTNRNVYLPQGTDWIDFWTGKAVKGGKTIIADAPISRIPLYIRAGSVLPLGNMDQYMGLQPDNSLEIRIYPGADGSFELYEDDGATFDYQKGKSSTISFKWNNKTKTLKIGEIQGKYNMPLPERTFHVVLVKGKNGNGTDKAVISEKVVYTGKARTLKL